MKFAPGTTPVAGGFHVVPKLNHPEIFGISWFAELNPQIDWYTHSVQLDLDDEQHTVIAAHADDSYSSIELYTAE